MFVAALAAGMVTIVPDRVPIGQRGVVLGWGGVPQAAALIVGGVLVSLSKGYVGQYAALAALMVFVVLFAWRVGDPPLPRNGVRRSVFRRIWRTTGFRCDSSLISGGRWRRGF
ncbi:hypothetical protein ACFQ9X_46180 [Catenulispora yoronensis]